MKYLIKPIIKHHYLTVLLILAITMILGYYLKDLKIDNDVTNMLEDDNPTKIAQKMIDKEFGAAEMLMIGLVTDNIFEAEFLTKVKKLSKNLKKLKIESNPFTDPETGEIRIKKKKCIASVTSLSTMKHIEGSEYGMEVSPLMKKVPKNNAEMDLLKERVFSWDFYIDNIVSADSKATLIAVEYKNNLAHEEIIKMAESVRNAVYQAEFDSNVEIYIAGQPFASAMITKDMSKDLGLMLPAVFGIVIIFLLIAMRNVPNVILIVVTIAVSVTWTTGLMGIFGIPMNLTTSAIPVLLVAIGSAYSIHIVNHYSDERAKGKNAEEAVENSMTIVGISVFGAALTTMAGFMSLGTSSIVPVREFGLFTGVGTGVAFIVSVIFVPALLLVFDNILKRGFKKKEEKKGKTSLDLVPSYISLTQKMTKNHKVVFSLSIIIVIIASAFASQLRPDLNLINYFKKHSEVRQADIFLCERFGGTTTSVIALESGRDDYFKEPEVLRKLDSLKQHMGKDPVVGMVLSLAEPIKRMNYAMNGNQKAYDAIPETKEHVSQYLLLNSDPEALEGMVTSDFSKARILILLKDGSSFTIKRVNAELNNWLKKEMPGIKVINAGTSQLALTMNELVVEGQMRSLFFSIIAVLIISSIILRSFVGGLLAITPLSISVILNFGILGILKIPLDAGTAMVSAIAIGIAVDYSIHLLNGIKHGLKMKSNEDAVRDGIKLTGNAVTFNALSVALGFLVLTSSSFTNLIKFGFFVSFTMITACAGTMLLLPVLVNTFNLGRFISPVKS